MLKSIFNCLLNIILDPNLGDNSVYHLNISEIWTKIKKIHPSNNIFNTNLFKKILKSNILENNKCLGLKNFLIEELSQLFSEISGNENIIDLLNEFPTISVSVCRLNF